MNAAHNTTSAGVPWAHWLSPVPHSHSDHHHDHEHNTPAQESFRVERAVMPLHSYAWTLLNTSAAWSTKFNSSGQYAWHLIRFSLSGMPAASDLVVSFDGADLHWAPRADIGVDRWIYDIKLNHALAEGEHEIKFTLKNKETEGEAQLCSVEVLEYGDESESVSVFVLSSSFPLSRDDGTLGIY